LKSFESVIGLCFFAPLHEILLRAARKAAKSAKIFVLFAPLREAKELPEFGMTRTLLKNCCPEDYSTPMETVQNMW
jgi:hypothetical protein